MRKVALFLAILLVPSFTFASPPIGYDAIEFETSINSLYCPTGDTQRAKNIYFSTTSNEYLYYSSDGGSYVYWVFGSSVIDTYDAGIWHYFSTPTGSPAPDDYTVYERVNVGTSGGDVYENTTSCPEDTPATSTSTTTNGVITYRDWIFVNGIIILLLSFVPMTYFMQSFKMKK